MDNGARYEKICQILAEEKKDKLDFLNRLLEITMVSGEICEKEEPVFAKAILYLTCWIVMPCTSVKVLPSEFITIFSMLDADTSSLLPLFFERLIGNYCGLSDIICNDTLISLCLTVPHHGTELLMALRAEHCIPPLLWLLTYSPQHLKLASSLLPIAISKQNGVNELILAFGRGDDSYKLKNLAIKVLKSTPVHQKSQYLTNVIPQMVSILGQYKCDNFVENIIQESLTHLLEKYPDILLQILKDTEKKLSLDELVKFHQILTQATPPHPIILFRVSLNFDLYLNLFEYLAEKPLELKSKLNKLLVQFFAYWEEAVISLVDFIEKPSCEFTFTEAEDGKIFVKEEAKVGKCIEVFDCISKLIELIAESNVAVKVNSKFFSVLLSKYNEDSEFWVVYFINYMLSNLEPIFLVSLEIHVQAFLEKSLSSDDEKLNLISLQILCQSLAKNFDSHFLIKISPQVIQLKNSPNETISKIALQVNDQISKLLISNNAISEVLEKNQFSQILEDLGCKEDYISAISAYRVSLNIPAMDKVPWGHFHSQLHRNLFVFGEIVKCYLAGLRRNPVEGLEELFLQFEISDLETQSRVIEVLFQWVRTGRLIEKYDEKLMRFLNEVIENAQSMELKNGAMVVVGKVLKRVKTGSYKYLAELINAILNILKSSNSKMLTQQPISELTTSALLVLAKVFKYSYLDHYKSYLPEILSTLKIFDFYYKSDDNIRVLLNNVLVQIPQIDFFL